jgi:hypothetical protein
MDRRGCWESGSGLVRTRGAAGNASRQRRAAGTQNGSSAANRMRAQIMRLLNKEFSRQYVLGSVSESVLAGRNQRDIDAKQIGDHTTWKIMQP